MAKKLGKLLALAAVIGAAAGAYYYYKSKDDSFDDFDDDMNDDLDEFLKSETDADSKREYVPLNFSKEAMAEAKETIKKAGESVEEAVANTVGTVETDSNILKPEAAGKVEEFEFDDLKEDTNA